MLHKSVSTQLISILFYWIVYTIPPTNNGAVKIMLWPCTMPQPGLPLSHKAEHIFDEINLSEKLEYYEIMIILIGKGYAYSLLQK